MIRTKAEHTTVVDDMLKTRKSEINKLKVHKIIILTENLFRKII